MVFGIGSSKSDRSFYEAFERHAACILEAGKLITQIVREPERSVELAKAIKDIEDAGDKITHETIARLHKTWITPIDRADIHSLITALDDVLDLIDAVSERVALYEVKDLPAFVVQLADSLQAATVAVDQAIKLLPQVKQPKEMLDLCVEINRLENEADNAYRHGLATLFKGGYDAIEVMKWRDIIDNLEMATDRCEDVANILEGIVLEYS
jgi:predicted phosphate transport protein (TIGR00153 family)